MCMQLLRIFPFLSDRSLDLYAASGFFHQHDWRLAIARLTCNAFELCLYVRCSEVPAVLEDQRMLDDTNGAVRRRQADDIVARHIHRAVLFDVRAVVRPRVPVDHPAEFDQLIARTA